jgi:coenzyme F420-reducing hydrogenase gamma subunit
LRLNTGASQVEVTLTNSDCLIELDVRVNGCPVQDDQIDLKSALGAVAETTRS